jgi:hypothetical protein
MVSYSSRATYLDESLGTQVRLSKCPFCGKAPVPSESSQGSHFIDHRCPVVGMVLTDSFSTLAALAAKWNKRPLTLPLPDATVSTFSC